MEQSFKDVSDAELQVLRVLWDRGPSTIGQVTDALYPSATDANYASVQVFLNRLEAKKHVRRDRSGRAHVFHALTDRDELVGRRLRVMAEKLCGGLMGPLLTHLVKAEALTPEEIQELRQLMDQLDRKPPPKDRRR
jgi:BlaI family transcriptional regulator, penicillinase repressor